MTIQHIDFKAPTIDLTDDVRAYAEEKIMSLSKLLGGADEENVRCDIELSQKNAQQSGDIFRADITVFNGGEKMHAVGHGETLFAALDESKDELARRLRRDKTKKENMLRRGGAAIKRMLRFGE